MLTKNAEHLLKKFVNDEFQTIHQNDQYIPEGEIYRNFSPNYQSKTELALAELIENGYVSKIAQSLFYTTTSGKTYFDIKKINFKNKIIWNITIPALLGFIGGTIPVWFNALIR
ncbi:hypothetical protein LQZ24_05945 [Fructobacillus sp. M1-13]|uniref:Uncharacterized protein n=1 Tax=Fructobacillus papyriferae TaxID=2713171 RepID=A0ABS5QP86_9LACO|nr:hypothetical protein [Fructobacillus papyriferae]MBS9334978.1 hypothetical protein [Fructobacillus papyriferae]MCD2159538.1 hypothetical protein [Fructobacillus papyriferae]